MINKKIHKNYIINYFLTCADKKGRNNMSKNLIANSSTKISKNNYNFYFNNLFYSIILNLFVPFYKKKIKNKYKNLYITNFKSISNILINIIKHIKKNKKKISFDFYLKNEIYTLLNNSNNLYNTKLNNITLFKDIDYNNKDTNFNLDININLQNYIDKKYVTKINCTYTYDNFYYIKNNKKINLKQKNNIILKLYRIIKELKHIIKI